MPSEYSFGVILNITGIEKSVLFISPKLYSLEAIMLVPFSTAAVTISQVFIRPQPQVTAARISAFSAM